jgi:hypothetical protein
MEAAWQLLQDEDDPHQFYPGQKMLKWINEAVEQIRQQRPDSLVDAAGVTLRTITPITDLSDTLSLDNRWKTAVIDWVVSRALQTDAEDEGDRKQAALHLQLGAQATAR